MSTIAKTYDLKIKSKTSNGGKIIISTPSVDRQSDRVFPLGGKTDRYRTNPIVCWGHNYYDPWATIGKTTSLEVAAAGIVAEFELRPATSENDPQTIIRGLWDGGWIKTASIGFLPLKSTRNEHGGFDFTEWELLEWSLVAVPAQAEAVALAIDVLRSGTKKGLSTFNPNLGLSQEVEKELYSLFYFLRDYFPKGQERSIVDNIITILLKQG